MPALASVASDVEILLERHVALDSRLLVGGVLPNVVNVAVNGEFAHLFPKDYLGGNGVGETPVVYDIILDMRLSGDAVNAYKVIACYVCTFVIFVVSREIAELVEGFRFVELEAETHGGGTHRLEVDFVTAVIKALQRGDITVSPDFVFVASTVYCADGVVFALRGPCVRAPFRIDCRSQAHGKGDS